MIYEILKHISKLFFKKIAFLKKNWFCGFFIQLSKNIFENVIQYIDNPAVFFNSPCTFFSDCDVK